MTSLQPPRYKFLTLARQGNDSLLLNVELRTGDKSRDITTGTVVGVMITRPDFTEGLPEMEITWPYVPQMASLKTFPSWKEDFIEFALGRSPMMTCVFVTKITVVFILGLDYFATTMQLWIWDASCYD
jgi:hypothetical protein